MREKTSHNKISDTRTRTIFPIYLVSSVFALPQNDKMHREIAIFCDQRKNTYHVWFTMYQVHVIRSTFGV